MFTVRVLLLLKNFQFSDDIKYNEAASSKSKYMG